MPWNLLGHRNPGRPRQRLSRWRRGVVSASFAHERSRDGVRVWRCPRPLANGMVPVTLTRGGSAVAPLPRVLGIRLATRGPMMVERPVGPGPGSLPATPLEPIPDPGGVWTLARVDKAHPMAPRGWRGSVSGSYSPAPPSAGGVAECRRTKTRLLGALKA